MVSSFLGSSVLETVIGIAFVYFLLSIICSAIQEVIASLLARRANDLEYGIAQLLGSAQLRDQLYSHPLIQALGTDRRPEWHVTGARLPAYIPADLFTTALLDLYAPAGTNAQTLASLREAVLARAQAGEEAAKALLVLIDTGRASTPLVRGAEDLRKLLADLDSPDKDAVLAKIDAAMSLEQARAVLLALPQGSARTSALGWLDDAQRGLQAARSSIEDWFNAAMSRVSGVYKRQVQYWLLLIALVVVLLAGADTIRIWRALQNSATIRGYLNQQAAQLVAGQAGGGATNVPRIDTSTVVSVTNTLDQLQGVLGYDFPQPQPGGGYQPPLASWIFWKLVGSLLTVFAVSLGAPFWFDVLQKAANLRAAGPPPPKKGGS